MSSWNGPHAPTEGQLHVLHGYSVSTLEVSPTPQALGPGGLQSMGSLRVGHD